MAANNNNLLQKELHHSNGLESQHLFSDKMISHFDRKIKPDSEDEISNQHIVTWINEYHKLLDADHEAGIKIDHSGEEIVFHIDHIGHTNKSMIYFKGYTKAGDLVHFVKHLSQLKIQLLKLKRKTPDVPKSPFGFSDWDTYEKNKLSIELD